MAPPPDAGDRTRPGEPLRWHARRCSLARGAGDGGRVAVGRVRRRRPQLRAARSCRPRRSTASSKAPRRRSRWPTAPWLQVFDDPALQALVREALANNLDLRVAVARVEEARARAGIAKSFLYPQVDGVASYGVRQASNSQTQDGRPTTIRRTRAAPTASSCRGSSICSADLRRQHEAALALAAGQRAGPPRRARHAGRRRRDQLLPAARARPAARDRPADAPPQRRDGRPTSRTGWTAACRTGSSSIASRPTAPRPPPRFPTIEQQIAIVENALSLLLGRPPAPIARERARPTAKRCRRRFRPDCRRRCSSGGPTSCRRSSSSWRPTPTSAPPRRCSFRRSA